MINLFRIKIFLGTIFLILSGCYNQSGKNSDIEPETETNEVQSGTRNDQDTETNTSDRTSSDIQIETDEDTTTDGLSPSVSSDSSISTDEAQSRTEFEDTLNILETETANATDQEDIQSDTAIPIDTNFIEAEPMLRDKFARTYKGTIVDGNASKACQWDGLGFTLTLEAPDEMSCYSGEIDQEVACNDVASSARISLEGYFEIEGQQPIEVEGGASIYATFDPPSLHIGIQLVHETNYYRENFEEEPPINTWEDEIEYFEWTMRHSEDSADEVIWESCWCMVD